MCRIQAGLLFLGIGILLLVPLSPAVAQEPPDSTRDTTQYRIPDAVRDSIIESTRDDIAEILNSMRGEGADTTDTGTTPRAVILPPTAIPRAGFTRSRHTFSELAAFPHVSFADHLLFWPELDAFSATEYGTERRFLYHGLSPLPVNVAVDGVNIDLRRPTFPQTMAPDLMALPPYMFLSLGEVPAGIAGTGANDIVVRTFDSSYSTPYSDFFVRRGDYGLSLTQGRLYRSLAGGRLINIGFSFAQSAGRGWYDSGENRYLYAKFITPVAGNYNVAVNAFQYANRSDIQTAEEFQRYQFQRDDLNWRVDALVFRGEPSCPWSARITHDNNKFQIKSDASTSLEQQWGSYARQLKKSRTSFDIRYAPTPDDTTGGYHLGATLALQHMTIEAKTSRRPEYSAWADAFTRLSAAHAAYIAVSFTGNDHDAPAPGLSGGWRFTPSDKYALELGGTRQRTIPTPADRRWPIYSAVFEDSDDRVYTYTEIGDEHLDSWWSNEVTARWDYRPAAWLSCGLSAWASYEQDYYFWRDVSANDTDFVYQPYVTDARTVGSNARLSFLGPGPFNSSFIYAFKRAEEISGARLPDYADHKFTAITQADVPVRKYNLVLHGAVEFMYWRAPAAEYTAYDSRNIFRTDVLGSATIKDFTIYWLAQNVFNYGYRRAPGYEFLGQTIMWGLHLRFYN